MDNKSENFAHAKKQNAIRNIVHVFRWELNAQIYVNAKIARTVTQST